MATFTDDEIAEMQSQLQTAQEMITAVATTLARTGPGLEAPVITQIDNTVIGTGNNQHTYSGTFVMASGKASMYLGTFAYSNTTGNYIEFKFYGFKAEWYGEKFPSHGIINVSVDGVSDGTVDQYSASEVTSSMLYDTGTLTQGIHTVRLTVSGTKHASSTNYYINHDSFKVYSTESSEVPPPVDGDYDYIVTNDAQMTAACAAATTGQIIAMQTGTYRNTYTPANNGVIIMAYPTHTVTVSGLDQISDGAWGSYDLTGGKQIYRTAVANGAMYTEYATGFNKDNFQYNNTQLLSQQLFKGSDMMFQASFPKPTSVENILERSSTRNRANAGGSFGATTITDAGFAAFGSNALIGGRVWINGWFITCTRTITAQSGNTITYGSTNDGGDHAFSNFYKVTDKLALLTQAKEWHYDGNYFYFWQQGGGSPTGVEYKKRNWGFDLRGKTGITITGLNFIGCEPVMTTTASTNIIIDNIKAKYTSHHVLETNGGSDGYNDSNVQTGLKLLGAGSILRNSEFNYASGVNVWAGSSVEIRNNKFQNGGYGGFYPGFIKFTWSGLTGAANVKVLNNTFTRSGRGAIEFTANSQGVLYSNIEIGYNDFSKFNMMCVDGGAIYGARQSKCTGSRIHHNWFHNDGGFDEGGTGQQRGIQVNGTYWDQASGPTQYDHNLHFNGISGAGRSGAYAAEFYTQPWYHEVGVYAIGKNYHYNNVYATATGGGQYSTVVFETNNTASVRDVYRNCIMRAGIVTDWGGESPDIANSLQSGTNPLFVGGSLTSPQTYFQLQSGSPARGAGVFLSGVNDGDTSPIEIGSYYYQQTPWVPGFNSVPYNP